MAKFRFYALWLSLVCIFFFILQTFSSKFTDMLVLNSLALGGEYWRFLSAIFLHGSLSHLIFNLFALIIFGLILEKLVGSRKFLIIFFVSGIVANLISVNFYPSSLGASGAIMGIIGAITVLRPFMFVWAFGLILPMFVAAILWVISDLLGLFIPSNVGNIAHLSGIAIGFLFGLYLRLKKGRRREIRNKLVIPDGYVRLWEERYMG